MAALDLTNPQWLNRYANVMKNPVNATGRLGCGTSVGNRMGSIAG